MQITFDGNNHVVQPPPAPESLAFLDWSESLVAAGRYPTTVWRVENEHHREYQPIPR